MTINVIHADSREALRDIPDASVDSCVCDPPYGLNFMGRTWDGGDAAAFDPAFWVEVLRILKPGAHLVAFGGTRTYHRLVCAIEDAGFEIRDQLAWLFGSGFPKSHDVSKGIDRAAGVEREVVGTIERQRGGSDDPTQSGGRNYRLAGGLQEVTTATSEAAKRWQGWGTALKPAHEPICLARKPLIGTVAANVLQHGTGALNIDASRIEATARPLRELDAKATDSKVYAGRMGEGGLGKGLDGGSKAVGSTDLGRWPANVLTDGSDEVLRHFPESDGQQGDVRGTEPSEPLGANTYGRMKDRVAANARLDSGSAARFFYTAKADAEDRLGSKHPTVKPVDLMAYLIKLVTPPGGLVLDPFAGSGTTGMACMREGFRAVLIEREAEYVEDIKRRLAHVKGEDAPLFSGLSA